MGPVKQDKFIAKYNTFTVWQSSGRKVYKTKNVLNLTMPYPGESSPLLLPKAVKGFPG